MSFCPAGFEDSDSDDEGFFMGGSNSYSAKTVNNKPDVNGMTGSSSKNFSGIPAGAGFCNPHPEDLEFETSKAQTDGRRKQHSSQKTSDSRNDGATGLGRGRGQLQQRGRGRGGFPRPPSSYSNRGKSSRRSNFSPNKSTQAETRKASLSLAVDDLRVAVEKGNIAAVQKYLDDGIDPDVHLKSGWTCLMLAASSSSYELMEFLVNRGANVNFHKEMYTVLMATCATSARIPEEQVFKCVELLLQKNARVNVYDKYRMSPLMYAAKEGRVKVCEKLLEQGAEINKQDMRGWTSLSFAASRGHGRVVRTLLDLGADPKVYSNDGQTASDIAYSNEYHAISDIISFVASGKQVASTEAATEEAMDQRSVNITEDSSLSYGSLELFLAGHELTHLLPKFQEHKVTFDGFLSLTEKELDQMGITQIGVRTKILDSIREIHKKEWDVTSLQALEKHSLSAAEVTVILANVSKYLTYVRSSVSYVQKHLNSVREPLEFVQDVTLAEGMVMYSREATEAVQSLSEELSSVKTQISQISSKVSNTAPDLIDYPKPQSSHSSSRVGVTLVAGMATVALGAFVFHRVWSNS